MTTSHSPEPQANPNPRLVVDPPWPVRALISKVLSKEADPARREKKRRAFEAKRKARGEPHTVEYFHQLDDPYSHLVTQVLSDFVQRYDIELVPHLVRAAGGKDQPELKKLAAWARRDCELIAPHYGLTFSSTAPQVPAGGQLHAAAEACAGLTPQEFLSRIPSISEDLWQGGASSTDKPSKQASAALDQGTKRLASLGHYSGATFYYGGEFYWGVDRLFHLEQRLMALGLRRDSGSNYLVTRPNINVDGVDASALTLHFYPSLNSPYTSIIYDRTIAMAKACKIQLQHKPVLPMVMRGVPASPNKGKYIVFDTKREAEYLGVPFGPMVFPIGTPTRRVYSLLAWAKKQGKDTQLLSTLLRMAFAEGISLATERGLRKGIERAGLSWTEATQFIGNDAWQERTAQYQQEMVEGMGLWGVPSYRLSGPDSEPDLAVWGQDRLWLIAAEIKRRAALIDK
jgi:2-hydroxychromene-2-carboxylate isomerase